MNKYDPISRGVLDINKNVMLNAPNMQSISLQALNAKVLFKNQFQISTTGIMLDTEHRMLTNDAPNHRVVKIIKR